MNISVIIPALNEAGNIRQLVSEVRTIAPVDVIVVDNGSTDATASEALAASANVVNEPRRGYGYACAAGIVHAHAADGLIFLDGDYSFLPADLPALATGAWCGGALAAAAGVGRADRDDSLSQHLGRQQ